MVVYNTHQLLYRQRNRLNKVHVKIMFSLMLIKQWTWLAHDNKRRSLEIGRCLFLSSIILTQTMLHTATLAFSEDHE